MKLIFNKPYKSIRRLPVTTLPELVVLTGINGAGKSQLLEAIENNAISVEGVPPNQIQGPKYIRRFDSTSLVTQDTGAFSGAQISTELSSYWENLKSHQNSQTESFYASLKHLQIPGFERMTIREIVDLDISRLVSMGLTPDYASQAVVNIAGVANSIESNVTSLFIQQDPNNRSRLVQKIASNNIKRVPMFAMSQDDFYDIYPDNWQQVDLFQQSFSRLFSAYAKNWRDNQLRSVGALRGVKLVALSDVEFQDKYGAPPWDYLNEVLEVSNLDFRINAPSLYEDRPYEPVLTDDKRKINVKFADLSSGERVLMSFALCLYHATDLRTGLEYPKVLLFDEIDAPLHPSMTSSLLRTIAKTLVRDREIKVILTTHSPSTVALAMDESIYIMRKGFFSEVSAASKDAALGVLTAGVPTLSVNYENRRQVFVESKYDAMFYSEIYERCKVELLPDISLTFIAAGKDGVGNCDQVISIVGQLRNAGSKTVLGIVDWDLHNAPTGGIQVLGVNERYAVENYILDPLLVGLLLLREKDLRPEQLGLAADVKYIGMGRGSSVDLAAIVINVVDVVKQHLDAKDVSSDEVIESIYGGDVSLTIPKWVALTQGHTLEAAVKDAFPALRRYHNEADLKLAIIRKVLDDFPHLVHRDIVGVFRNLQVFAS